jgi:hypothetical protein
VSACVAITAFVMVVFRGPAISADAEHAERR